MLRNLLWLGLIVVAGIQIFGSCCWMGEMQGDINRLTSDVRTLTNANLMLADKIGELEDADDELVADIADQPSGRGNLSLALRD